MKIKCAHDELVEIHKIIENPKNPNKHPQAQIERLAKLIDFQGQRHPIIVSKRSGFVVVGHGRLAAIKLLGWEKAAVNFQDFDSEAQEYSFVVSDNAIAEWAELDLSEINKEMLDLGPDFDIDMLGIDGFSIDLSEKENENDDEYTRKIEPPIYEPKGEKPSASDLFSNEKTKELIAKIDSVNLPSDVRDFILHAAYRHTKFNYQKIAEFYAHADKQTQLLMEESALVVIDFNKAIELGFVKLTKDLEDIISDE